MDPSLSPIVDSHGPENESLEFSEEISQFGPQRPREVNKHRSFVRKIGSSLPIAARRKRRFRNRSLVRWIGSSIPLKPCRRPYFEVLVESNRKFLNQAKQFIDTNVNTVKSHVATLADVGVLWDDIANEEAEESCYPATFCEEDSSLFSLDDRDHMNRDLSISQINQSHVEEKSGSKIVALEEELARLREQIAMIVSTKPQDDSNATLNDTQSSFSLSAPAPPPPPPPPTPMKFGSSNAPRHSTPQKKKDLTENEPDTKKQKQVPSMNDVLQGLGKVKLRSVNMKRSPGGTPLRSRQPLRNLNSTNPADIIANALRNKFAKSRHSIGSPGNKENQMSPCTGFSPTPPPTPEDHKVKNRRRSGLLQEHGILNVIKENY